jgi:hypothetical protein
MSLVLERRRLAGGGWSVSFGVGRAGYSRQRTCSWASRIFRGQKRQIEGGRVGSRRTTGLLFASVRPTGGCLMSALESTPVGASGSDWSRGGAAVRRASHPSRAGEASGRVVILLQKIDDLLPGRRVGETAVRFHVVVGNDRLGILDPALECRLVPGHSRLAEAL